MVLAAVGYFSSFRSNTNLRSNTYVFAHPTWLILYATENPTTRLYDCLVKNPMKLHVLFYVSALLWL